MAKQLMIYDNIQPLSAKHAKWSVSVDDFSFTAHLNSCPVLASEIVAAAAEFPIIFSTTAVEGEYIPLAVMGLKDDQNLMLDANNLPTTRYIPAFLRRYPFVLSGTKESDTMALCIDEDSKAFDKEGVKGKPLFNANGEQSEYLIEIGEFLKDYHFRAELTHAFTRRLHELDLLEPMTANITIKNETINLGGFYVVKREKLKAISDADALDFFKKDGLEIIYAHLQSIGNFNRLIDLMSSRLDAPTA